MIVDIVLTLTDRKGRRSSGKLAVRVREKSLVEMGDGALERTQSTEQRLSSSAPKNHATGSVNDDLVASFNSLLAKVDILVKIGDEIAKVCPLLFGFLFSRSEPPQDSSIRQFCVADTLCRT